MSQLKRAFIAIGSNLNNPMQQVENAIQSLTTHTAINIISCSNWYESQAIGPDEQPDYINGAVSVTTKLHAIGLLRALQEIELHQGRIREQRWAARTLDLDLLWYNNEHIHEPDLHVPHPRICERNFVLAPLNDIAPELILEQQTIHQHLVRIGTKGIKKI